MNPKVFITFLLETPMSEITWENKMFTWDILSGYTSAYSMHKMYKKKYEEIKLSDLENDAESHHRPPPAYININKRFRKLHRLGILEEEKVIGGFSHGARNYKVSEKGLVVLIADGIHPEIYKNVERFSQSELFKTFIIPYFENHTISQCTYTFTLFIQYYLEDICSKINNTLNPYILESYQYDPKLPLSKQYNLKNTDPDEDPFEIIFPIKQILIQLETSHKSLILDLLLMNEKIFDLHPKPTKEDKVKTFQLLSKDKRFMKEVKRIKSDIDNSYQKLLNF